MSRTNSLRYDLRSKLLPGIQNNNSLRARKRAIEDFTAWAKAEPERPKHLADVTVSVLQQYADDLRADPRDYTASTIHSKLSPICVAAGINMNEVRKPKRRSNTIVRGRNPEANAQGKREVQEPRFARLTALQGAVGIRRAELKHLTGKDWDGTYVTVERGKNGKRQRQYVLPEDRQIVNQIFANVKPDQRVFSDAEMTNKIDLHGMRAEHARKCYQYYLEHTKGRRARGRLRADLLTAWDEGHPGEPKDSQRRKAFAATLYDNSPYCLRGSNRAKAIKNGLPVEYNRLCLMAVSVRHLAHWRLGVTVTNYLIP